MPRHNRRRDAEPAAEPPRPGRGLGERIDTWRGEEYVVRSVAGSGAAKHYRCPGCDQEVRPGLPHVVAWPVHDAEASDRRHWHSPCWSARDRRSPGIQRSRSAPRY